jgi:hypothetical protein
MSMSVSISLQPGTVLSEFEPQYSPSLGGALEFQYEEPLFEMGYTVEEPSAVRSEVLDELELDAVEPSIDWLVSAPASSPPLLPPPPLSPDWPLHPARPAAPAAPVAAMKFRRDTRSRRRSWSSVITCTVRRIY